jgi:hypothetical protein
MPLDINLNITMQPADTAKLDAMLLQLGFLKTQGATIMATLDEILADVQAETSLISGVSTLIDGLKTQLAAALANESLSPAVQAQVDQIFATAEANKAALAVALVENTPPVVV